MFGRAYQALVSRPLGDKWVVLSSRRGLDVATGKDLRRIEKSDAAETEDCRERLTAGRTFAWDRPSGEGLSGVAMSWLARRRAA